MRLAYTAIVLLAACGSHHGGTGASPDATGGVGNDGRIDSSTDGPRDGVAGDDGSSGDAAGSGSELCDAHHWLPLISVSGSAMMRYRGKTYVFAQAGTAWAIVENGVAQTSAIPLPAGVATMQAVTAEIGLDGTPLVWFATAGTHYYATRFDGAAFSAPIDLAGAGTIHGDAAGRIYAYGPTGLTEYPLGGAPIVRGAFPFGTPLAWTVGPDGTVYVLRDVTVGSNRELRIDHLPHGSLTWSGETIVTTNAGYGFYSAVIAAAADNSLHIAYMLGGAQYFRSHDGITWDHSYASDFQSTATLIDFAPGDEIIDPPDRPADVNGYTFLMSPQDYDRASITLAFPTSSLYTSSQYFLRRCTPFIGTNLTWPAERLAYSEAWGYDANVAIDEHGLASIMTPLGLRVDVAP